MLYQVPRCSPPPPPPPSAPESDAQARARQRDMLREMGQLGMRAARAATERIEKNEASPDDAERTPSLTLARAATVVREAIALEQKLLSGAGAAPRKPVQFRGPADPRRAKIREALREAAKQAEPDRTARNELNHQIDEHLDAALADDSEQKIPIGQILFAVSKEIGLPIDVTQLSDELLGMPPRRHTPDHR